MSKPKVNRVKTVADRSLPIFDELDQLAERIRERAFRFFEDRGFAVGDELQDWFRAEREICWPASELIENDSFELKLELPGYDADHITVTATPRDLIVKASHEEHAKRPANDEESVVRWSELNREDVYRHVKLPVDIDPDEVTATFKRGILTVKAPKSEEPPKVARKVDVSTAA